MTEETKGRSFSLITHDRTISLIARSVPVCRTWVRALNTLLENARNVGVDYFIGRNAFSMYLQEQWNRADTDRSGVIDSDEMFEVMRKMNINLNKQLVKKLIGKHKVDRSTAGLNLEEFTLVFRELFSERPEVKEIWGEIDRLQREATKSRRQSAEISTHGRLGANEFRLFYNAFQRGEDEPEMTADAAQAVIRDYTEDDDMGLIEFAQYLDDDRNSIFDPQRRAPGAGGDLDRYMSFPLSHYWISSSHNTYLTSDQLQGVSSSDQYTYVLQNGCRCVELDCWDGEKAVPPGNPGDEPVITHGHTMCTKIFFRDVIRTLKTRAFGPPANNPYPVILSIEMHCSHPFQERMYEICQAELGDMLYLLPPDCAGMERLPSPHELRGKILVKGKRTVDASDDAGAADDDDDDDSQAPLATPAEVASLPRMRSRPPAPAPASVPFETGRPADRPSARIGSAFRKAAGAHASESPCRRALAAPIFPASLHAHRQPHTFSVPPPALKARGARRCPSPGRPAPAQAPPALVRSMSGPPGPGPGCS